MFLEAELTNLKTYKEQSQNRIRELEIENTTLEGTNRTVSASAEDLDDKYKSLLEQLALVEGEIEQKNELNQRLQDEIKGTEQRDSKVCVLKL